METEHYVYALDTTEEIITAALSCPDLQSAKQSYLTAKREYGEHSYIKFGFVSVCFQVGIEYHKYGWRTSSVFSCNDFQFAASQTEKILSAEKKRFENDDDDIEFMRFAMSALQELTDGSAKCTVAKNEPAIIAKPIEPDIADSPRMIQAASGVCVPDIIKAYNESIDDSDGKFPNVNIANVTKPIPVYFVDPPKDATLEPKDCPVEGNGGFWESHTKYAERIGRQPGTLTGYRKTNAGARWSSDGTWGETKRGEHIFKVIEPGKSNSETVWWVRYK